jgi:hypothetical protein
LNVPIPEGYAHKEHRTKGANDLENTVKLSFALEELRSNFPDLMKKFSSPDKKSLQIQIQTPTWSCKSSG